jgi:indolepyruvate ferredoxin oxidoreductase beta subunit
VRISDKPVASDLIATGAASMVLSMEPMEALRYTPLLRPDGWIVTDLTPLENDAYPQHEALYKVLFAVPRLLALDATRMAQKAGTVKAQNMVVLGAGASQLPLPVELLEKQIQALFAGKGERIVKANVNAFRMGHAASRFAAALVAAGVSSQLLARLLPRLVFEPQPVAQQLLDAWCRRLLATDGAQTATRLFEADKALALDQVPA